MENDRLAVGTSWWVDAFYYKVTGYTPHGYTVILGQMLGIRREIEVSRDFLEREHGVSITRPLARQIDSARESTERTQEQEALERRMERLEYEQRNPMI